MFIRQHNLNKLITLIDFNKQESLDLTEKILSVEPLLDKIEAFGLNAIQINGHSFIEIDRAFKEAKQSKKPSVIIAHTIKGKGVSFMENKVEWHYRNPNDIQLEQALAELDCTQ